MTTSLDQLRRTLREHAEGVYDDAASRPTSVARRVRGVRRRRLATAAMGAVMGTAATVGVVALALPRSDPGPVTPTTPTALPRLPKADTINGVHVPEYRTYRGRSYHETVGRGRDLSHDITARVPRSPYPVLVVGGFHAGLTTTTCSFFHDGQLAGTFTRVGKGTAVDAALDPGTVGTVTLRCTSSADLVGRGFLVFYLTGPKY